jgi:hypothetical protein
VRRSPRQQIECQQTAPDEIVSSIVGGETAAMLSRSMRSAAPRRSHRQMRWRFHRALI